MAINRAIVWSCLWVLLVVGVAWAQPPEPQRVADQSAIAWVTPNVVAPRVTFHTFESAAAKAQVSYHLYTPTAYDAAESKDRRFPVVYWLHGSGGGAAGIAKVAAHFDAAIEAGKTPPFLVVFVNGLVEGMYVDWKDGTAPLETVIVNDLVPHIDGAYRTIATREGRMLDGFSMGGYGAGRVDPGASRGAQASRGSAREGLRRRSGVLPCGQPADARRAERPSDHQGLAGPYGHR